MDFAFYSPLSPPYWDYSSLIFFSIYLSSFVKKSPIYTILLWFSFFLFFSDNSPLSIYHILSYLLFHQKGNFTKSPGHFHFQIFYFLFITTIFSSFLQYNRPDTFLTYLCPYHFSLYSFSNSHSFSLLYFVYPYLLFPLSFDSFTILFSFTFFF